MQERLRYYFQYLHECNMCGSDIKHHKVLGKRLNTSQGTNPRNKIGIAVTIVKCTNCGLIYSNPMPIPFDLEDHYGVPPNEYWEKEYFHIPDNYFKHEIEVLKTLIDFKAGMKSLDIGAGIGKQMIVLHKLGFDVYGLEPSKQFHKMGTHILSKTGIPPNRLKLGRIEDVEYKEDFFDFISFAAVLEHLYDPSGAILKALKWLKPGGIIHIEVPSSNWLIAKLANMYYRIIGTDYVANLSPMHKPYHLYEFGLKSFKEHAKRHGYEIAFYEYYVARTFMPKFVDYFIRPIMKWTNTGMQLCVWLRKN